MGNNKLPQILAPCGDMDALKSAIANGADAVYLGLDLFNARIRAKNFTLDNIEEAVKLAHAHNVSVFVTLNIAIYDREIQLVLDYVNKLWLANVDALIVSDLGIATLIREFYPDFEIHASTQCTAHSLSGADFLYEKMGASQVVLARELPKNEIEHIAYLFTALTVCPFQDNALCPMQWVGEVEIEVSVLSPVACHTKSVVRVATTLALRICR